MPWMNLSELVPPLNSMEREEIADGRSICRQLEDGVVVVSPRVVRGFYPPGMRVTGVNVTFGPKGEAAFFHRGGRLEART